MAGGPHWGVALTGDYVATPNFSAFEGYSTTLQYDVTRELGAIAGLGFNFGPLAIGANAKYYNSAVYSITSYKFHDAIKGPPEASFFEELLTTNPDGSSDSTVEVGLGAILTLGTLNAGIYNDNIMPFINKDEFEAIYGGDYAKAFLSTMNFGVSWMPSDNKFGKSKVPLVLLASADLKNFGDETNRQLCAGLESGLNAGDFLVLLARVGYTQPLLGPLDTMFDNLNVSQGYATFGTTAKFWFAKFDLAFTMPMTVLRDMDIIASSSSPYAATDHFASLSATVSFAP